MEVIVILLAGTAVFRLLGAFGVRRFGSWPVAAAHFVPAGVTVMPNHADLVAMVPPFVPFADAAPTPLAQRIAEQALYIAIAIALAVTARSDRAPALRLLRIRLNRTTVHHAS